MTIYFFRPANDQPLEISVSIFNALGNMAVSRIDTSNIRTVVLSATGSIQNCIGNDSIDPDVPIFNSVGYKRRYELIFRQADQNMRGTDIWVAINQSGALLECYDRFSNKLVEMDGKYILDYNKQEANHLLQFEVWP